MFKSQVSGNASRTLTYGKEAFSVGQGVPSVWDSLTQLFTRKRLLLTGIQAF